MQDEKNDKPEENLLKQKIFDYVAELVSNEISIHLYILFLVIDNLQYIAYYNNGLLKYNSLPFDIFSMFADYINLLNFLRKYNINQILVPIFFVFNAIHVLLLIVGYRSHQRKMQKLNKTVYERNYHKNKVQYFVNLLITLQTTILTIPMFQCSLTAFYCSSDNPFTLRQNCYVGSHIIIAAMGFVNLVWILFINFFIVVYYNRNPFSTTFSTCSSNWYNLGRFIVKITPMLFIMYDPTISFPILFLIVMNVTYPAYLFAFSKFLFGYYRYNFKLQKIVVGIQTFTCFLNIGFIFVQLFQNVNAKPNTVLLFWCGAAFVVSLVVAELTGTLKRRLIKQISSTQKKSLPQILQFMIYLIYQTEQSEDIKKEGFFVANIARKHQLKCQDATCYCVNFMEQRKKIGYNKDKAVFYTLLLAIIDKIIKLNKKAYPFFILKAYILYYKLESQIKAATTISIIMSEKLDFSDELLVKGLLFELNQQYNDTRDMEIYRKFNEFVLKQQEQTLLIVDLYLSYWEELIDQNSSIPKMRHILRQIKKEKAKMQTIVDGALGIFNNHVRVLFLHKTFLKEVINDIPGSLRYEQRYKIGLNQSKLSNVDTVNKIQFRPNQNLLVINFTRNYDMHSDVLGNYKIMSISSNIREFLGYSNSELKDTSINKLIPRIYHKYHDSFIDTVLQKRDVEIISYQFRIYPINSSGNIIECNLISKFMPNISYGINIVSFIEQCDVEKDQYVMIYDSKTGIVDSMSKQTENLLKDSSKRKNNDVFASANDFIGNLLPQWDYKNQVWKQSFKNKKTIKSLVEESEEKIDVKQIEVVRSDGLKEKDIKILKFKGSFFSKIFSLSNDSDRLQRDMYVFNPRNMLKNPNSGEIQRIGTPKSKDLIDREKQPKRETNEILKTFKGQILSIQPLPSQFSRVVFILIQCFILFLGLGLTTFLFITTNMTVINYAEDSQLIYNLNTLQSYQSNMTYIISLISANKAYTNSTISLPYKSYISQISAEKKLAQIDQMLNQITQSVAIVNPILVQKIGEKEISQHQLMIDAKYLKIRGKKQYFTKSMTIVQTIYQYISYVRQFIKDRRDFKLNIADILPSSFYFFIFANSLDTFPDTMTKIKQSILNSISTSVSASFKIFLVVKLVITALIICSLITVILYYRYIYKKFIWKVITLHEQIPLQKITIFEQKCRKYKYYVKQKIQKKQQQQPRSTACVMNINSSINLYKKESSHINEEDQNNYLLKIQNNLEQPEVEQLITFESKPQLKNIICSKIVWIIIYGIMLFILCYSFSNSTQSLSKGIMTLNNYTLAQNSMIQIRLYTHLSLNMLNYWQPSSLKIINQQLKQDFVLLMELMNNTSLNFTKYKPYISAKYTQLKFVQYYRTINDTAKINQLTQTIESTLQDMDSMLIYLLGQCTNYLNVMQDDTQIKATYLNIYISFSLFYLLIYWAVGVRYYYRKLLDEHQIAYEMYNMIGFDTRKEIESIT